MLESVTHCSVQNAHRMWSQLLSQHICHIKTQPAVSDRDQELETWLCARSHFGRRAACALQELQRHILSLQNVLSCLCFITAFEQVFFADFIFLTVVGLSRGSVTKVLYNVSHCIRLPQSSL